MSAQRNIYGNRATAARPVIIDGMTLLPGPASASSDLSRRAAFTSVGNPTIALERPPLLSMQWVDVVSDFPVASWLRSLERVLLAPANINESRLFAWPELLHAIELDRQQYVGYLMSYEVGEDAKRASNGATYNNNHTWSAGLAFSLAPNRTINPLPSLSDAPVVTGGTGSIFRHLSIVHSAVGTLHSPSSIRWSNGGSRDNKYTVAGEAMVMANFREPGELTFSWSNLPDVTPGADMYNVSYPQYIMVSKFEAFRKVSAYVQIWGFDPIDGRMKQLAWGKVIQIKYAPLAGQPPRYEATMRVALKAAR